MNKHLSFLSMLFLSTFAANAEDEVVLTATRLKQPITEAPASVTVLTSDEIERSGARSIPEALSLVPGLTVISGGRNTNVGYHGAYGAVARHLQVLVDGMIAYRPGESRVEWNTLPVTLSDVDRIEVIRGPNAAAFGTNAFTATINIITKSPSETSGIRSKTFAKEGKWDQTIQFGTLLSDDDHFRLTINAHETDARRHVRDSNTGSSIHLSYDHHVDNANLLELRLGGSQVHQQVQFLEASVVDYPDSKESQQYASLKWTKDFSNEHQLVVSAYGTYGKQEQDWLSCFPAFSLMPELHQLFILNRSYVARLLANQFPTGGGAEADALRNAVLLRARQLGANLMSSMCGNSNQDYSESLSVVEFQDTIVFSDSFRMVFGGGSQNIATRSESYLGRSVDVDNYKLFSTAEYRVNDFVFNIGAMIEDSGTVSENAVMPRGAVNYILDPQQSFRLVVSKSERTPDIFEQNADWNYAFSNFDVNYYGGTEPLYHFGHSESPGNLENEKIKSSEIGYRFSNNDADVDVRVFKEDLTNLITEQLRYMGTTPTNDGEIRQKGVELEAAVDVGPLKFNAGYTYLDHQTDNVASYVWRRHSGFAGFEYTNGDYLLGVRYYGGSQYLGTPRDYSINVLRTQLSNTAEDYLELDLRKEFFFNNEHRALLGIFLRERLGGEQYLLPTFADDSQSSLWLQVTLD